MIIRTCEEDKRRMLDDERAFSVSHPDYEEVSSNYARDLVNLIRKSVTFMSEARAWREEYAPLPEHRQQELAVDMAEGMVLEACRLSWRRGESAAANLYEEALKKREAGL